MWLDVMSQYNTLEVNIKLANVLGLHTAVYWAELMNIYARVVRKFLPELEENEGYFELDREYITYRTTLSVEEQLQIDAGLARLGVLVTRENEPNWIKVDVQKFCAMLIDDNVDMIYELQKISKLNRDDKAKAKKYSVRINLMAALSETDSDVIEAYRNWIDSILEAKKPLTKQGIEIYQRNLNNYTDNKQVKLKILEIATMNTYVDFAWSMKIYEKDYARGGSFIGSSASKRQKAEIDSTSGF